MEDIITPTPLPGTEQNVPAAGSGEAVSDPAVNLKDLMKSIVGKDFPDDETAIKSIKDTFNYVGQAGQKVKTLETQLAEAQAASASNPALEQTVKSIQEQLTNREFYDSRPEFNNPEAKALIGKFGGKPEDVVNDDIFKKAYEALKTTADLDKSKSILHSNPRLGVAQDNMTKAADAQKAGNTEAAANAATAAVLEAYNL